ncbi:MAG TPA: ATP-binding protein [Pirellulales bacterium]|nr:ATP-binding protein [Pirellulales bacterium]
MWLPPARGDMTSPLSNLPTDAMLPPPVEREVARSVARWIIAAYACIAIALGSVLGISVWGVFHDLNEIRMTRLHAELNRLRSHAARTVSMIQDSLNQQGQGATLDTLHQSDWVRVHWVRTVSSDPARLYAAVVDPSGRIVMHSDPAAEGKHLGPSWSHHVADDVGQDVLETDDKSLAEGQRAYDISVPIFFHDQHIASYHVGFNRGWFEETAAEAQYRAKLRWGVILGFMLAVVAASFVSLYHITRRATLLGESVRLAHARRFAELGQLIGGIAHEIRNPLNAMILNLHTLERFGRRSATRNGSFDQSNDSDSLAIIRETAREVERVEELMKILLGYARPEWPNNAYISVADELESILRFLRPGMDSGEIRIHAHVPDEKALVYIDRNRLRQILLNLLNNAREAVGERGCIDVTIERSDGAVVIEVADDGPGVPIGDRNRIFEPFFSTKELGTGLGLPLVRRFVEEAGGTIEYVENDTEGACFRLTFQEAIPPEENGQVTDSMPVHEPLQPATQRVVK